MKISKKELIDSLQVKEEIENANLREKIEQKLKDTKKEESEKMQQDLINSLGGSLAGAEDQAKHTMLSHFYKADAKYGEGLTRVAKGDLNRVKALAAKLKD